MELTETFSFSAPRMRVWRLLSDVQVITECIPGAELVADHGENTWEGRIAFTLGPKKMVFSGTVVFERDEIAMRGRLTAKGDNGSGSSKASGHVEYSVDSVDDGNHSTVKVVTAVQFYGPLSDFAESGGLHVGRRLLYEFSKCLRVKLAAASDEAAARVHARTDDGLELIFTALWNRLRELFGQAPATGESRNGSGVDPSAVARGKDSAQSDISRQLGGDA